MSNAVITTVGGDYQVTGSQRVHVLVAMDLSGGVGSEGEFTIAFPVGAAPTITIVHGAVSQPVTFAAAPPDPSPVFVDRSVGVAHSDDAVSRTVTFTIGDLSLNPSTNDVWTVKLVGLPVAAGTTIVTPSVHVVGLTVEADPVLNCPASAGTFSAGASIALTAQARRNTMPLPTAASYNPPTPVLAWSQTSGPTTILTPGAVSPVAVGTPAAPGFTTTATTVAPGVTATLGYLFTATFGEFSASCPVTAQVTAVNHRWMIALDRSNTMTGTKWSKATAAANLWADLVSAFRLPDSMQDSIGVLTLDDPASQFRAMAPAASVQVRWPGAAMGPIRAVTDPTMDGFKIGAASALGTPQNQTPLGDGLVTSLDAMVAAGTGAGDRYDLVVFSDGVENTGTVKVDPASTIGNAAAASNFDAVKRAGSRTVLTFGAGGNVNVYPVGPISPSPVNSAPLNVLGTYGQGPFPMAAGLPDILPTAFGSGLLPRLGAAQVTINLAALTTDPSFATNKQVYFLVPAGDDKLAVVVLCDNAARDKTLHLLWRQQNSVAGFSPVPAAAQTNAVRDGYLLTVVDLTTISTVATEWRVGVTKTTAGVTSNEDVLAPNVLAGRDLNVRSEITFDRESYYNDEPIVVRGAVFADGQPVKDAHIAVELDGPALSEGELLAAHASGAGPDSREAALVRVLASTKRSMLPTVSYKSVFIDGTNQLQPDATAAGHYANVFTKNWREGRYDFRFTISGRTADGGSFSDVFRASRLVKIRADDASSPVVVSGFDALAPKGLRAARVSVTPTDAMGQRLGPYRGEDVAFLTSSGTFVGDVESAYDGSYSQALLYPESHRPVVTVRVQGRTFTPALVAPGFIGMIAGLVRRAQAWLVRSARRA